MTIAPESPTTTTVVLSKVPTQRFLALTEHLEGLLGELTVVASRVQDRRPPPVERLLGLLEGLGGPFAAVRRAARVAAEQASTNGAAAFALALELPAASANLMAQWNRLLDEADWACSHGVLLTLPMPPELVDLRRWIGAQVSAALPLARR
ncbi:MAG: hypothetical protein JOZ37_09800 [Actinobacteria bacterium]|nr:hypothetical protein [Actinomycetota bacterium]MBV9664249.1 hypothetical protein [Actinomycetota bacterium]MBV9932820.1 hypothetical protein [Actinomycetota bacterium]